MGFMDKMKQAKDMYGNMKKIQQELDKIQVKGKTEPETIFGLFSNEISPEERKLQESFLEAYKKGDYQKSSNNLDNLIKLKGNLANFLKKKIKTKKYYIYLSLSDDKPWAQATVIISYN